MSIWFKTYSISELQRIIKDTLAETLGIELTELTDDSLKCKMFINNNTMQPMRFLHGGASTALAETLGSMASNLVIDNSKYFCVGLEINANHIRPVSSGYVYAEAKPIHLGKKTHVWGVEILDDKGKLACISRLTTAVISVSKFKQ
jgi:1,4-dihydroxy-2-naphthoyl-CoA hydrolase